MEGQHGRPDEWVPPVPVEQWQVDEYLAEWRRQHEPSFEHPRREMFEKFCAHLQAALSRLNSLPASDSFWRSAPKPPQKTGGCLFNWPGFLLLDDYFRPRASNSVASDEDLWTCAALRVVVYTSNSFGYPYWLRLAARDLRVLRWMVESADIIQEDCGVLTAPILHRALLEFEAKNRDLRERMRALFNDTDPALISAVHYALKLLETGP